jgi:hypothetical protein
MSTVAFGEGWKPKGRSRLVKMICVVAFKNIRAFGVIRG